MADEWEDITDKINIMNNPLPGAFNRRYHDGIKFLVGIAVAFGNYDKIQFEKDDRGRVRFLNFFTFLLFNGVSVEYEKVSDTFEYIRPDDYMENPGVRYVWDPETLKGRAFKKVNG